MPKADPQVLDAMLARALGGELEPLAVFLKANSNLPGPRGNLELAGQFAEALGGLAAGSRAEAAWQVVAGLAAVGPGEAPVGDPGEFLAFCGTVAAGGFAADPSRRRAGWEVIRRAAEDERWRLREAAAQAIQRALPFDRTGGLAVLEDWAGTGPWLICRAVAAGVADPPLLADPVLAVAALHLHEAVLGRFVTAPDRKDAGWRVLRQGLGYTLSVAVAAAPEAGFELLRRLALVPDRDLARVLRSNLGKNRLARDHARQVETVRVLLSG